MLRSVALHHSDVDLVCYLIDCDGPPPALPLYPGEEVSTARREVRLVGRKDFESPGINLARGYLDMFELACASKTAAMRHALETLNYAKVLYLDSDIFCFAPFDSVFESLENRAFLVTPHCLAPLELEGGHTDDYDLLKVGHMNAGFLAASAEAVRLGILEWLEARILRYGFNSAAAGLFVDQKWVSVLPCFFPEMVGVLADPGVNVGHWNAAARNLKCDGNTLLAGDAVLSLFHFSGYDPAAPDSLTRFQHRPVPPTGVAALALVLELYGRALREVEHFPVNWPVDAALPDKSPGDRLEAYKAVYGKNAVHYLMRQELIKRDALEQGERDKKALAAYSGLPAWLLWLVRRYQWRGRRPDAPNQQSSSAP